MNTKLVIDTLRRNNVLQHQCISLQIFIINCSGATSTVIAQDLEEVECCAYLWPLTGHLGCVPKPGAGSQACDRSEGQGFPGKEAERPYSLQTFVYSLRI